VLRTLGRLGAGADVVSGGELRKALKAGIPGNKIVFSGVGKTRAEMKLALEAGIYQFNVESEPELQRINRIAARLGKIAPVAVRVNPNIEAHTHHKPDSAGSLCVSCHMPMIEETLGDVKVHAHTFRFITPAETETLKIPNACNLCHADKATAWAADVLKSWNERSPWRMQQ